ncbi:MAG: hypothetical protein AB9M60_09535 [Leptothrix sp. (in: b-proteobacteria)]
MKKLAAIAVTAVLTACGGGGSGGSSGNSAGAAEGIWSGTFASGTSASFVVLENGDTWGVYVSNGVLVGAANATTTVNGSTFSGTERFYDLSTGQVTTGSYSGTAAAKSTLTTVDSAGGTSFTGTYVTAYDQPATLSAIAGSFSGTAVVGGAGSQTASVSIGANGAITVPSSGGCTTTGSITPRASGKNIYNVSLSFSGTGCVLGNGASTTGIAYYKVTTGQVLLLTLTPDKSTGLMYLATKV